MGDHTEQLHSFQARIPFDQLEELNESVISELTLFASVELLNKGFAPMKEIFEFAGDT